MRKGCSEMQWNASVFLWFGVCAFYMHSGGCLTANMHSCAFTPRSCAFPPHSCAFITASCKRRARCKHECHPRHPLSPLWLVCGWHSSGTAHPVRIHAHSKRMRLNAHQMHRNAVSWWKTTSTHTRIHASKPDAERGRKCTE